MGQKDTGKKEPEKKGASSSSGDGGGVTVVLRVDLHCEGCAQKVKRSLKHFDGVESVKADFATKKLTVVGKLDPAKIKEKVENKTKKKVDLVSPQPPPKKDKDDGSGGDGGKRSDENPEKKSPPANDNKNTEQKKSKEAAVTTVVLKTKVHCDGCAHKINKIINKCEGVKEVNVDLAKDQIMVKGTMNMTEILPYLNTKLKRAVEMALPPKKDDKKPNGGDSGGSNGGGDKKGKEVVKPDSGGGEKKKKNGEGKPTSNGGGEGGSKAAEENASKIEVVNRMEYSGYPSGYGAYAHNPQQAQGNGYVTEYWNGPDYGHATDNMDAPPHYLHAPQMFSDENPNACSVM